MLLSLGLVAACSKKEEAASAPAPAEPAPTAAAAEAAPAAPAEAAPAEAAAAPAETAQGAGVVTVEVDTIAQPHAMVSGHVTFSDGEKADWYIDHQGRPGMAARTPGYRPTPQDITDFQVKLDAALRQAGY